MLGDRGTSLLAANGVTPRSRPPFRALSCPAPWSPVGLVGTVDQAVPPPARCTPHSGASASSHPFFVFYQPLLGQASVLFITQSEAESVRKPPPGFFRGSGFTELAPVAVRAGRAAPALRGGAHPQNPGAARSCSTRARTGTFDFPAGKSR